MMGNLLQAIGRAQPATQIRQALRDRSQDMRENERMQLDRLRTDAYIKSQENSAKIQAQQLEQITRKNQVEADALAWAETSVTPESILSKLDTPEEQALVSKYLEDSKYLNPNGIKQKHLAKIFKDMTEGPIAEQLMATGIDATRKNFNTIKEQYDKALAEGDVGKASKLKPKMLETQTMLERKQARSETWRTRQEEKRKQAELAVKQKNAQTSRMNANKKSETGGYEKDKGKLVDDTRAFYSAKAKQLLDPESGLIRQGPKEDPNKYIKEYQAIQKEMKSDMNKIRKGELPSWFGGEDEPKTDEDIATLLKNNGYKATPEAIATFRKNNGL